MRLKVGRRRRRRRTWREGRRKNEVGKGKLGRGSEVSSEMHRMKVMKRKKRRAVMSKKEVGQGKLRRGTMRIKL